MKNHHRIGSHFAAAFCLAGAITFASPAAGQVTNSTWLGDGTGNFSNGNWSNSALWNPNTVPNNSGMLFDVTIPYYPGNQQFNGPQLDINVTIRNLTMINRVFIDNQGNSGTNLTVTGSSTFTTSAGNDGEFGAIFFSGGTLSLGTLTNYTAATKTLEAGFLFPLNGGTIQFRGADIVTNNATLIIGDGSQLLNQNNGALAYANLAVNNGGFNLGGGHNFTTPGNFTNNGGLTVGTSGNLSSVFTVGGTLTNFDAATRTLTGGYDFTVDSGAGTGTATLRFAGADIRNIVNTSVRFHGTGASIQDLAGQNGLRNLRGILNGIFTSAGTMTITPNGGTFTVDNATHNIDPAAQTTIQGNYVSANSGVTRIGSPTNNSNTSLVITGSSVIQGGGLDFGGQPGVNTQYYSTLQVINGIEFRGAYLTGTGTTFADIGLIQGSVFAPGRSPGQMTITGALMMDSTNTTKIEIGGLIAGEEYDQVVQQGTSAVTLGGTLDLKVIDGFESSIQNSDTFDIVVSDNTLTGAFSNVASGDRLSTSDGIGSFIVTYAGQTKVTLSAFVFAPRVTSVSSRKTHANGVFDLPVALTGGPTVESRNEGGNHHLVFLFNNPVTVNGEALINAPNGGNVSSVSYSGQMVIVELTGVANAQLATITLSGFIDDFGQTMPDTDVPVGFLIGDSTGEGLVNTGDAIQVRGRAGQPSTQTNFRSDINLDGLVNSGDAISVRARSGSSIFQ